MRSASPGRRSGRSWLAIHAAGNGAVTRRSARAKRMPRASGANCFVGRNSHCQGASSPHRTAASSGPATPEGDTRFAAEALRLSVHGIPRRFCDRYTLCQIRTQTAAGRSVLTGRETTSESETENGSVLP